MKDGELVTMKNGKPGVRGVCQTCGTKMFRFVSEWDLDAVGDDLFEQELVQLEEARAEEARAREEARFKEAEERNEISRLEREESAARYRLSCEVDAAAKKRRLRWQIPAIVAVIIIIVAFVVVAWRPDWRAQTSGTTAALVGVTFIDADHGWVVGEGGTILATDDGGKTWWRQRSGYANDVLYAVAFTDPAHGWAVGDDSMILATGDGGLTWRRQHLGHKGYLLAGIAFTDPDHGWVVGGSTLFATTNGGKTWREQKFGWPGDSFTGITFTDAAHGWVVGRTEREYYFGYASTDGGRTWSDHEVYRDDSFASNWHPAYNAAPGGYARLGDEYDTEGDGALAWQVQSTGDGEESTVSATKDGGTNWTEETLGTAAILHDVTFIDSDHGWVVGEGGTILATTWERAATQSGGGFLKTALYIVVVGGMLMFLLACVGFLGAFAWLCVTSFWSHMFRD